jgi:hypothetical protein
VPGEPADQLGGVVGEGVVMARAGPVHLDGSGAGGTALPDDGHLGDPPRVLDGEDDLADDGADQLLAFMQRDGRGVEDRLNASFPSGRRLNLLSGRADRPERNS